MIWSAAESCATGCRAAGIATDARRTPVLYGGNRGRVPGMTDDASRILAADLLDEADQAVEGTLRPHSLAEYIGQREVKACLLYTSPSPRDGLLSRMPSSA